MNPEPGLEIRRSTGNPLFAMPPVVGGELVSSRRSRTKSESARPASRQAVGDNEGAPNETAPQDMQRPASTSDMLDFVGEIQDRASERDRLLGVCRGLRAAHRCPGECVLSARRHERLVEEISRNGQLE